MLANLNSAKKRHEGMRRANRRTIVAITLCATLAVTGCGKGASGGHEHHAAVNSGETTGSKGSQTAPELTDDDAAKTGEKSEHEGHGLDAASDSVQSGAHEGHGGHDGHNGDHSSDEGTSITWSMSPKHPRAGEPFEMSARIMDADGKPIQKFEISHEKLMHLIVVSEDLSEFYHLHPDYDGANGFTETATLASGGNYAMFADYKPAGKSSTTGTGRIHVAGEAPSKPLVPDDDLTTLADGIKVSLDLSSVQAGVETALTFRFSDEESGEAFTDLEPYLGAIGHVVVIGEAASHYLHVHAESDGGKGPKAEFATKFPSEGLYRIWGQFQREGKPFTVAFTVKVQ